MWHLSSSTCEQARYALRQLKLADLAAIEKLNKQIEQTKAKRDKEKQFNRKRELNDQFKALNKQLAALHGG